MLWTNLTRLTLSELWQSRSYKALLVLALLSPLLAMTVSSLFMVDIGKVYMDGIAAMSQLLAIFFLVFLVVTLLTRDIFQRVCYILLTPPVTRNDYFIGRFIGVAVAFLMLLLLLFASSALSGWLYLAEKSEFYQSGYAWYHLAQLIFFNYFQYISIVGFIFFIVSWSSGDTESMLFTVAILIFSWVFPPVLKAMQSVAVAQQTPDSVVLMLQWLYEVLPHLQGSEIALSLAHGMSIDSTAAVYYVLEHGLYALVFFLLGLLIFNRRDL